MSPIYLATNIARGTAHSLAPMLEKLRLFLLNIISCQHDQKLLRNISSKILELAQYIHIVEHYLHINSSFLFSSWTCLCIGTLFSFSGKFSHFLGSLFFLYLRNEAIKGREIHKLFLDHQTHPSPSVCTAFLEQGYKREYT